MIINDPKKKKIRIKSVDEDQKIEIKNYLKNLIEIWCRNTPEKSFTCFELLAEKKDDWKIPPLCYMYEHYIQKGESKEKAIKHDSVDVGWLLKEVISEMPRKFEAESNYRKTYTYIPE